MCPSFFLNSSKKSRLTDYFEIHFFHMQKYIDFSCIDIEKLTIKLFFFCESMLIWVSVYATICPLKKWLFLWYINKFVLPSKKKKKNNLISKRFNCNLGYFRFTENVGLLCSEIDYWGKSMLNLYQLDFQWDTWLKLVCINGLSFPFLNFFH